jgi:anti-sigma factor RsiW
MSTTKISPITDEELQRYFDDELSANERASVEARLDADARLRLEALHELRSVLRAHADVHADLSPLSSVIDAIERTPLGATPLRAPVKRRWLPMSAVGGLLAAAAALVVFLHPIAPNVVGGNASEIESLEVQGELATVFHVESGNDRATVIWTDDSTEADNAGASE